MVMLMDINCINSAVLCGGILGYRSVGGIVSGGGLGDVRGLGIVEGVRDVETICFLIQAQ